MFAVFVGKLFMRRSQLGLEVYDWYAWYNHVSSMVESKLFQYEISGCGIP